MGAKLPLYIALSLLVVGGIFLLEKAEAQARDTTRKHHLQDIEQALYLARNIRGTFPPYNQPTWCGVLSLEKNPRITSQVENALRRQNEKYSNENKPFPRDPLINKGEKAPHYFYWKRSPATFELYSILETDRNGDRSTANCDRSQNHSYDYGISSVWREN